MLKSGQTTLIYDRPTKDYSAASSSPVIDRRAAAKCAWFCSTAITTFAFPNRRPKAEVMYCQIGSDSSSSRASAHSDNLDWNQVEVQHGRETSLTNLLFEQIYKLVQQQKQLNHQSIAGSQSIVTTRTQRRNKPGRQRNNDKDSNNSRSRSRCRNRSNTPSNKSTSGSSKQACTTNHRTSLQLFQFIQQITTGSQNIVATRTQRRNKPGRHRNQDSNNSCSWSRCRSRRNTDGRATTCESAAKSMLSPSPSVYPDKPSSGVTHSNH